MLSNCDAEEDSWESPGQQGEIKSVNPKGNQPWIFIRRTDAEAEAPMLWPPDSKSWLIGKDPDAGKDWRQEEKGDDRGWDGWMASLTQWTWVWVDSRSLWWTGRTGVLLSMELQRVGHDWVTELNCIELQGRTEHSLGIAVTISTGPWVRSPLYFWAIIESFRISHWSCTFTTPLW